MVDFKVGDTVKVIPKWETLIEGGALSGEYQVAEIDGEFLRLDGVKRADGKLAGWLPFRFRLVRRAGVLSFIKDKPKARANDPATSKAAAKAVKPKVPSIKETILFLLARNPSGLTGTEIAELSGKRLNSITPRFAELYRGSKIKSTAYSSYRNGETVWVLA